WLRAGRPPHLSVSDGRRKHEGADRPPGSVGHSAHLSAVPAAGRAQEQHGPPALRRRAGDAGDRPRASAQSKLIILDEPSQGLAPLIVQEVFRVVTSARKEGISVLLVEQNVRAACENADRCYVL